MNIINNLRANFQYFIVPFALVVIVGVMAGLKSIGIGVAPQKYIMKLPREFFHNKDLAIGDGFSKVSQITELIQHWYYDGLSTERKLTDGYYLSEMGNFHFDRLGRLERLSISVSNTDSLTWIDFLKKNMRIMVSYYGKICTIYRVKKFESVIIVEWKLNEDYRLYLSCDLKNDSPQLLNKDDIFIEFNYDNVLWSDCFTKNETLESLGLY